ncbi:MAG: glycoside hydrolase [Actinobacteria bacterium]|nr:glycoside hydrolase [Actinomycetota bacterium]
MHINFPTRRHFRRVSGFVVAVAVATPAMATAQDRPLVTQAVQVTPNPDPVRAHSSPQIALNPDNGELVIVESNPRGSKEERTCDVHISTDAGQNWFDGGSLMKEPFTDCSLHGDYGPYATMAFAEDGTLYVAFVASDPEFADPSLFSPLALSRATVEVQSLGTTSLLGGPFFSHPPRRVPRNVFLARSDDGGRSFETSTVFIGAEKPARAPAKLPPDGENKGPMLAVDPEDGSRVYVGWRQGDLTDDTRKLRTVVAASEDGGKTFNEPVDVSDERGGDYPALAVTPDGAVHAVFWTRDFSAPAPAPEDDPAGEEADGPAPPQAAPPEEEPAPVAPIQHVRSDDQGRTWSEPVPIDPGNQDAQRPPLLTADPGSGALYMVWYAHAEPMNDSDDFDGDLDVFFRVATDGGISWSDRLTINDDDGGANQFEPGIDVGPEGRIDVAWYDFRNSPDGGKSEEGISDVYYTFSEDGGQTFAPNLRVNDRQIDRSIGVWSNGVDSRFNVGLTSGDEVAHLAWQDSRNGRPDTGAEDVYMASVHLDGTVSADSDRSGLAVWALVAAGVALGMGIAMVAGVVVTRRLSES